MPEKSAKLHTTVVDVGARYGLHPSWQKLATDVAFHLFEIDPEEAGRLREKYRASPNISVHELGLMDKKDEMEVHVYKHRALTSFLSANKKVLEDNEHMVEETEVTRSFFVKTERLDSVFADQAVHFLKVDTEGADIYVLRGASHQLKEHVLGVRSEVYFAELFKGSADFSAIHGFLTQMDFELLNLDYDGKGKFYSPYAMGGRFGKLISTDGVWVRPWKQVLRRAKPEPELAADIVRYCTFLMHNGATDIAIHYLLIAAKEGIRLDSGIDPQLFQRLDLAVKLLFKDLLYVPSINVVQLCRDYELIFKKEFGLMHNFYQNLDR